MDNTTVERQSRGGVAFGGVDSNRLPSSQGA